MFYESERIIRKNRRYVKSRACRIIEEAKRQGLTDEEVVFANECALKHEDILNETQIDILKTVRRIAQLNMESEDAQNSTSINGGSDDSRLSGQGDKGTTTAKQVDLSN